MADESPAEAAAALAPDLERFFRSRGHGASAPDLVQELFVLLLSKGASTERGPGAFRSFLFAIAYRLGANATRRRRREEPALDARRPEALAPADPETLAIVRGRTRRAAAALESLPTETRRALLLVADDGMSAREAARELGVSEEVVRARLCRGRRRLAAILDEGGDR
jgi:RNA polymerase sigma-70 factor (ECF subfamily)